MKNKLLYIFLLSSILWACNDEPEFPDPGLDATRSLIDTVRRDTIDSYRIAMNISAPNGVERIQVLNGRNYDVIQEFAEEYRGRKEFTFEYDVDLREIKNDTTLLYIVKVIDRNMRSYNKGFTLNVKKFSFPDIKIAGVPDGLLGLVSPVVQLRAQFETGLNTIDSYQVLFENEVIDEKSFPDTLMHEFKYKQVLGVAMEDMDKEYELKIKLKDNQGTVGEKTVKLRLLEMKRPVKVTVLRNGSLNREYELFYDEEHDRLDRMVCVWNTTAATRYYNFEYTEDGKVSGWYYINEGNEERAYDIVYTYDAAGRLVTMDYRDTDPGNVIQVIDWYDHGGVKSFRHGTVTTPATDVHYTPELRGDGVVFSEFWFNRDRYNINNRRYCEDMTAVLVPTYFPEMPIMTLGIFQPEEQMRELFFYKYVFEKTVHAVSGVTTHVVSYTTDATGRLLTLRRSQLNLTTGAVSGYWEYQFTYAE